MTTTVADKPAKEKGQGRGVVGRYMVNPFSCANVERLRGGVVRKSYTLSNPTHAERFRREVEY
jgi:hypothetical protein